MENEPPAFDDFWAIAKHMRGRLPNPRANARKAWGKAMKEGYDPNRVIAGLKGYLRAMMDTDTDCRYICQAVRFLNGEYWDQYLDEPEAIKYLGTLKRTSSE